MSSGKFALSVMDTQELETAHELSVKSYSEDYTNHKTTGTTPLVKKTKSKVKTCNGKRFFNNPYYAGTPLAALAAAVKKVNNQGYHHPRSGQRSGNTSATKLAARAYKLQLQAYQAAQARIAAEQEQQDQEIVDVIVSAESSLSRGATLGNFAGEQQPQQPQQPIVMCSAAFEIPASSQISKNNSSFLNERQDSSSIHNNNSEYLQQRHGSSHHQSAYPSQHQASSFFGNELENFSFTSQQFLASQQQPQQPQQPQFLSVPQQQFNQAVNVLSSSSSSGAGSEDERQMMQQYNNNNNTFVVHHQQQQQFQYVDQQPEQPAFGFAFNKMQDDFLPPQPKSMQQNQNQTQNQQQHKYAPNTTFVVVMFKYELCSFQCKFVVCEGDWVVVQADRGEHVGRVQSVTTEAPVFHVPYEILRHANFTEIASIEANHPREQQAAQRIHQIAMDLQLPLAITDTEFYADGNKMTVFFSSKTTVDFRELQRRVFREFRRRIWLINNAEVQYRNRNCRNRK